MEMNLTPHLHKYLTPTQNTKTKTKKNYLSPQMASLVFKKSSSRKKDVAVVGKSKHHDIMMIKCKKHPKHKQSPGVCSLCLREKLSKISSTSGSSSLKCVTMGSYCSSSSSSSSLSSYYSSSASSSCSSPMYNKFTNDHDQGNHYYSFSTLLFGGGKNNRVLTKSRSLAFVPRTGSDDKQGDQNNKKSRNGIFSKLLKPRTKKIDEGLLHSRTTREIMVAS